jgi:hypothetical protein
MNLKVILNALLIILILHLLIKNSGVSEVIGSSKERFENSAPVDNNTMNFLMKGGDTVVNVGQNDNIRNKLVDYVSRNTATYFEVNKNALGDSNMNVMPSNIYQNDENHPNFESNVANISKFYENNFDNLEQKDLENSPVNNQNLLMDQNPQTIDNISKQACNIDTNANLPVISDQQWSYKNEVPMNGGSFMGNITGFCDHDAQYSIYDTSSLNVSSCVDSTSKNDIRKPDIVN